MQNVTQKQIHPSSGTKNLILCCAKTIDDIGAKCQTAMLSICLNNIFKFKNWDWKQFKFKFKNWNWRQKSILAFQAFCLSSCCVETRINQSWIDIYWLIPQTIWDRDGLFSSNITHFLSISFKRTSSIWNLFQAAHY